MLEGIGDWMFGGARANRQRTEERHEDSRKRIQALLESESARKLWYNARAAAASGVDPEIQKVEKLARIRKAEDAYSVEGEITPEMKAAFDAAKSSVLESRDNREYFAPQDETDVIEALGKKKSIPTGVDPIDRAINVAGGRKTLPKTDKGEMGVFEEMGAPRISDYFQAPTETVPQGNVPKTYPQMGIESIDDQAVLSEMQKALPEVDMKSEYESDPEMMKKLMELWRTKKLTKQNLHKAFSMIQQSAQQSLGIR